MFGKKARFCLLFSLVLSVSLLAGCWNRKEVNEISFVTAAGIDKKNDQVKLTVQLLRPRKQHNPGDPNAVTLTVHGKTVFEAVRMLNLTLPRKAFWSHAFVIIASEEIAKEGLLKYIDLFRRDHEMRQDMMLLITEHPEQLLKLAPKMEIVIARGLKDTVRGGEAFMGIPLFSTLHEVSKMLHSKSPYAAVSHAGLIQEGKWHRIDGLSFFRKDRMVGTVKGTDASGWLWITGRIKSTVIPLPCSKQKDGDGSKLSLEIIMPPAKSR